MTWFGKRKGRHDFGLVRERGDIQKFQKFSKKNFQKKFSKKNFQKKKFQKKNFKKKFSKNSYIKFPFHELLHTSEIWYIDLHI